MNEIKYGTEQRIQYVYGRGQNLAVLIRRNTTLWEVKKNEEKLRKKCFLYFKRPYE